MRKAIFFSFSLGSLMFALTFVMFTSTLMPAFAWDRDFREIVCTEPYEVIEKAIKNGADVNFQPAWESETVYTESPLVVAITEKRVTVAELLLKYGADPNLYIGRGIHPIMIAADNGNNETLSLLLKYGADIDKEDGENKTALIYAALAGKIESVNILLQNKADIHHQDIFGYTAFHYAAMKKHKSLYELLLKSGADKKLKNQDGQTAEDYTLTW